MEKENPDVPEKEDVNLTIAKLNLAVGLLTATYDSDLEDERGPVVAAAAKYLKKMFK